MAQTFPFARGVQKKSGYPRPAEPWPIRRGLAPQGFTEHTGSNVPTSGNYFHLHLVSDSTGETLITVARAVAAQYANVTAVEHVYPLVRSQKQLDRVLDEIEEAPGIVLFTLLEKDLVLRLEAKCKEINIPSLLESLKKPLVVSLHATPERLIQVRQNRLLSMGAGPRNSSEDYIDRQSVADEVAYARRLSAKFNWAQLDVTRRSIEETAAAVLKLYTDRLRARLPE